MKKLGWVKIYALVFCFSQQSQAALYDFDKLFPQAVGSYIEQIKSGSKDEGSAQCQSLMEPLIQDGVLDIRYAFGYFDFSDTGTSITHNGTNYGFSPSIDPHAFEMMRQVIKGSCKTNKMRLCEFKESAGRHAGQFFYEKQINILGKSTVVKIQLTKASATEYFAQNTGSSKESQKTLSAISDENFFGGLQSADVVFYNGHSRSGGGPDFNPPVLNSARKADYSGYYKVKRPGIKRSLASMAQNPNKKFVLGLFSCYSRRNFQKDLMSLNPQQKMILSSDTVSYFDTLNASIGYLEGILRGLCGNDLANTAKKGEQIRKDFQGYNL